MHRANGTFTPPMARTARDTHSVCLLWIASSSRVLLPAKKQRGGQPREGALAA
jgi:hypothetical protein